MSRSLQFKLHKELHKWEQRIEQLRAHDKLTTEQRSALNAASVKVATIKYKLKNLARRQPLLGFPEGDYDMPPGTKQ